jgi:uncharacterized membrane protein YphA (DoxX/SURF4 family)
MQNAHAAPSLTRPASRSLHVGLWVVQALLAVMFGMAGVSKSTQPIAQLAQQLVWPGDVPEGLVRFIGVSELLGALGLLLPSLTRIKPGLTPLAAAGLVAVMGMAAVFHLTRAEYGGLVFNLVLGALAAFVAWGRFRKAPIAPRGS